MGTVVAVIGLVTLMPLARALAKLGASQPHDAGASSSPAGKSVK
jgi:hypothetical protein